MSLEKLGLPATASENQVRSAYRRLAQQLHPDKGGSHEAFQQLQVDYQEALEEASQPLPCTECGGRGRIAFAGGFSTMYLPCELCGGIGQRERGI